MFYTPEQLFIFSSALIVTLLIDAVFGEPPARIHPVVGMGWYLQRSGACFAPCAQLTENRTEHPSHPYRIFAAGMFAWLLGAAVVVGIAALVSTALATLAWPLHALCLGLALKPLFSARMLFSEVAAVEAALAVSLEHGRARLAYLVSRDVTQLTEVEVRESAIETLAENLNDSVIAPLFWFALAGLPGAALYRFANTADAMWGYRGERNGRIWTWAGKWAARCDDVLSWLPARLTSVLLCCVAGRGYLTGLAREARKADSPNGGWPMACMALLLQIRLGKPHSYTFNPDARLATAQDTQHALLICQLSYWVFIGMLVSGYGLLRLSTMMSTMMSTSQGLLYG
jgi:adenosylcobinamide-phosphate synthase